MDKLELETPALLVDLDILDRNIRDYATVGQQHGVKVRPHAKTPKIPAIVHRQLAAGAVGVCVATFDEAWTMVNAGITDLLMPYPIVGEQKLAQLVRLMDHARVAVNLDNLEVAQGLAQAVARAGKQLPVLVKVDIGFERFGLPPEARALLAFIQEVEKMKGLSFQGLMTFIGGLSDRSLAEIKAIGRREGETLVSLARDLEQAGVEVAEISVGSTSTARYAAQVAGVTEIRPGTYVFNDVTMLDRGVCREADCALTVLGTVVTKPTADRVVVDIGSKTLTLASASAKGGYGLVKQSEGLRLQRLTEEHAVLEAPGLAKRFVIGQKIEVIPNACGEVINLFNEALGTREDQVSLVWPILARGYSHYHLINGTG